MARVHLGKGQMYNRFIECLLMRISLQTFAVLVSTSGCPLFMYTESAIYYWFYTCTLCIQHHS